MRKALLSLIPVILFGGVFILSLFKSWDGFAVLSFIATVLASITFIDFIDEIRD